MSDVDHDSRSPFIQHDRWFRRTSGESGTDLIYSDAHCCYCARPVRPDVTKLRTARTNDGEWWLVGPDVDLSATEWRDFQRQTDGTFGPTWLPVGPDCLRRHPGWRFAASFVVTNQPLAAVIEQEDP